MPSVGRVDCRLRRDTFAIVARRGYVDRFDAGGGAGGLSLVLTESYERYVAAIDAARVTIDTSPFVRDDADRTLGRQFLRAVVNWSLAVALNLDRERPMMQLLPDPETRLGFNNPDNLYYVARVTDTGKYRISGQRGTSIGLMVLALQELPGNGDGSGVTTAFLSGGDLELDADGSYSITLSAERPAVGNWLPLAAGTDNLLVRFTFQDWNRERRGSIAIERLDVAGTGQARMTRDDATAVLDDAARSIELQAQFYRDQGLLVTALPANTMLPPRQARGEGVHAAQWNSSGRFDLADDEALVVTIKDAPHAQYHDIMVADPWLNTFEFVEHQAGLNRAQARVDADGYLRYVVSAQDPGVPNWLETTGQRHGILFARWQDVRGGLTKEHAPGAQVLNLAELRNALPDETPVVNRTERTRQLVERERQVRERFRDADPTLPEIVRRRDGLERLLGKRLPMQTIDLDVIDTKPASDNQAEPARRG